MTLTRIRDLTTLIAVPPRFRTEEAEPSLKEELTDYIDSLTPLISSDPVQHAAFRNFLREYKPHFGEDYLFIMTIKDHEIDQVVCEIREAVDEETARYSEKYK